jgi:hypothetical protein
VRPVTEHFLKCRWADPSQKAPLLKMVGSLTPSARPRAKLQDFETLAIFIAEQIWDVLLNDHIDYHSKAALFCHNAVALQLRHPTEPTVGCMIALMFLSTESPVKARSTSPEYQHDLFMTLKNMLKKRSKIPPVAIIDKLGSDPALFMVLYPDIFAPVFARGGPVRPQVTMAEITVISNSINMRNRKGCREKTMNPLASSSSSSGGDPFQAMMKQFMMQSMGAIFNRPPAGSMHLPGGPQLQIVGSGATPVPEAASLQPNGFQIAVQPKLALAASPPHEAVVAPPPPLEPFAAPQPKRSVDDEAAAIMDAMAKRTDIREEMKDEKKIAAKGEMQRPAAAQTGKPEKPPVTGKPEKRPAAAETGKPEKSSSPLFSVEASLSQVLCVWQRPDEGFQVQQREG